MITFRKTRGPDGKWHEEEVCGVLLKAEGGFVCWDSFKSCWFLGPRHLSEVFASVSSVRVADALACYPKARFVDNVERYVY